MDTKIDSKSRASRLAKQLEQDIRNRALRVGDQYMTASEAAAMFGVSASTADRAMKLLADSELLLRRQNQGTFIGPQAADLHSSRVRTVHVVLPFELNASLIRSDLIMNGIRNEYDGVSVQFSFLSQKDAILYVRELIDQAKSDDRIAGIVPMSGPREVYRLLAEANVPSVVVGSLYLGDPIIASIDTDNRNAGRLLAEHLVKQGHKRIALLAVSEYLPGFHDFSDGVSEALADAKLPPTALLVRQVPNDLNSLSAITHHTLQLADRPTAFIVQHEHMMEKIVSAAAEIGFNTPDDIDIVFEDLIATQSHHPRNVCTRPKASTEEISLQIGKILKALSKGKTLEQQRIVVPVELYYPSSGTREQS